MNWAGVGVLILPKKDIFVPEISVNKPAQKSELYPFIVSYQSPYPRP